MNQSRSSETPKYFYQRAWIYSKEMFPVFVYIPYVVALYFCVNIVIQILDSFIFQSAMNYSDVLISCSMH